MIHIARLADPTIETLTQHHFHFHHKDEVRVELKVSNNADSPTKLSTTGFLVDLTEPVMGGLVDGVDINNDVQYTVIFIAIVMHQNQSKLYCLRYIFI